MLLERLGVGGMSEVDLARKGAGEEFVRFLVIKRIKADRTDDEAFVRMFKDEARITSELHHNNIAQIYDFGRHEDEYYMALEFVPGLDMRRIINTLRKRRQRVPVRVALRMIHDVLLALDYAHSKVDQLGNPMNIVHRDVNPRNIMVSVRGETKLIDFGVAKATGRLERTKTDHVKGKFAYMAPEQVTSREIDGRADLFAVGLTLHELFTGYGPFHGLSQVQIMHRLIAGRIPSLVRVPEEFRDPEFAKKVHDKSLEVKPENRYQSASEFAKDIENLAAPMGGLANQDEMIRFLSIVDEDLIERTRSKIENYSGAIDVSGLAEATTAPGTNPADFTGTLSEPGELPSQGSLTVTRTVLAAGSAFAGGAIAVGVVLVLVLGGLVAWKWDVMFPGAPPPTTAQALGDGVLEPVDPEGPTVVTDVQPDDGTGAVADSEPEAPVKPPPTADPRDEPPTDAGSQGTDRADPSDTDANPDATADPDGPAPDVEAPPTDAGDAQGTGDQDGPGTDGGSDVEAPVTETPPPPDPPVVTDTGTLQVTSVDKGRAIRIDGADTGKVTPAMIEVPVGKHTIEVEGYSSIEASVGKNQRKPVIFR